MKEESLLAAADARTGTGPTRIQLSRAKGWTMPPNTVKVDRSTKWGNPWTVSDCATIFELSPERAAEMAVSLFRNGLLRGLPAVGFTVSEVAAELRGKNLACWCKPGSPCHADVLLELANGPREGGSINRRATTNSTPNLPLEGET